MKILLVSHQLDYSGAPTALLAAARVFRELDVELDLFPLSQGPLLSDFTEIGVKVALSPFFSNYSLVILNTALSSHIAFRIPDGTPYVIWLHESPNLFVHSEIPLVVANAANRARALVFPSESTANEWGRYGSLRRERKNVLIATAPVEIPSFKDFENRQSDASICGSLKIVSIDPLEYFRGHKILAYAFGILIARGLKIRYTAVGPSFDQLNPVFGGLQLDNLVGTGRIPRASVLEHLSDSHVYVSTTAFATQNLGLCEASLLGIPSVVSDIPVHKSWSENLGAGVIISRLFDFESVAERVLHVYQNYQYYRSISLASKDKAQKLLSPERFNEFIVGLIRAV